MFLSSKYYFAQYYTTQYTITFSDVNNSNAFKLFYFLQEHLLKTANLYKNT